MSISVASTPVASSWFGDSYLINALRSTFWSSSSAAEVSEGDARAAEEDLRPEQFVKKLPCHPVLCKILARRWIKATTSLTPTRRYSGPHPVLCKILAHRWVKLMAAKHVTTPRPLRILEQLTEGERQSLLQAVVDQLEWQRGTPICLDNLERLYVETRNMILGDRIYRLVSLIDVENPGKVTGMLLEGFSTEQIYNTLFSADATLAASLFLELVQEAHDVLAEWGMAELANEGPDEATESAADAEVTPDDEWTVVTAKSRRRQRALLSSPQPHE